MKFIGLVVFVAAICFANAKLTWHMGQPTRRGVMVTGPAAGMCAGVEETINSAETATTVYLARCTGAFSTNRSGAASYDATFGYLKMHIEGMALIRGADGSYLTNFSKCPTDNDLTSCRAYDSIFVFEQSSSGTPNVGNGPWYQRASGEDCGAGCTYAFSTMGAYFGGNGLPGAGDGLYAGTATYLMTKGSVSTNTNDFMIETNKKKVCITQISGAEGAQTCTGTKRNFKEGSYKFAIFGYLKENTIGNIKVHMDGAAGANWTHIGFRQRVSLLSPPAGSAVSFEITLMDGTTKTLDTIAGQSVKKFKLCVGTSKCLYYTFPTKYNRGMVVGDDAKVNPGGKTGDIKIKMSKPDAGTCTKCVYIDYLIPVEQKNMVWFAYDPDVSTTATTSPASKTAAFSLATLALAFFAMW